MNIHTAFTNSLSAAAELTNALPPWYGMLDMNLMKAASGNVETGVVMTDSLSEIFGLC